MNKLRDKIIKTFLRNDKSMRAQQFLFMSLLGTIAMIFGVVYTLSEGLGIRNVVALLFGAFFMGGLFWAGKKFNAYEVCAFILIIGLNCVILPITFVRSGGMESGMPSWLILGFIALFFLLRGKYMFICSILTVIADSVCIYIAFCHPEFITHMDNKNTIYVDIIVSSAVTILLTCAFMFIQISLYEYQRKENEEQQAKLVVAMNTQSRFLANMSHEIRTPINTIIGLNEMTLREENISDEIAENSNNIQSASKMLLALINDILDFSKIEAGKMEVVPARYETSAIFSEIVNSTWVRAHEKNLEFRVNVSPNLPSMLYGDEMRIKQILNNLLSNAIKYTKQGSVTLFVEGERTGPDALLLKMSVIDTGMGIRKDDMKHLFTSFQRVNESNTKGIEGTGLGLSIASQLVSLMDGKISVDSIYQKGSTFTVTIPQKILSVVPIGNINYNTTAKRSHSTYKKSFEAAEARVLVVDDNDMNLLVAKKLLRDTKVQLSLAHSGEECLKLTARNGYDVIFMDHIMPDMDGEKTLDMIRNQEGGFCRRVPVIALTANAMSGAEEKYRNMGFSDYLAKPINGMLLEAMLLRYLPKERIDYIMDEDEMAEFGGLHVLGQKKKQKLIISTDNVADIPMDIVRQYGIHMLHYFVNTEHGHFEDMVEIHADSLISYIQKGEKVESEPPTVEAYENYFGDLLEEAEQVIHISIASGAGKGFENASQAAAGFAHVGVYDSGHLSSGTGLMVIQAAKMALKNMSYNEVIEELDDMQQKVRTSFVLANADQLYISGRLNKYIWKISDIFECHPVLAMRKNKIMPSGIFFGSTENVYKKYVRSQMKLYHAINDRVLFITVAGCSKETKDMLINEVQKYIHFDNVYIQEASAAITSNCGPGCMGLIYMVK